MIRFLFRQQWMYLWFSAKFCSWKGNPNICSKKPSKTGSASCSISIRGTLLNGSLLWNKMFVHLSFLCQRDTVMTRGSMCTALRLSYLCYQSCSSDGNSTSSVWKNAWSSCAIPVDSMFSSIVCVRTSSLGLRISFSFGLESQTDKKPAALFFCQELVCWWNQSVGKKSYSFQIRDRIISVRKSCVTDLLAVEMITGFGDAQEMRPSSLNAKYNAKILQRERSISFLKEWEFRRCLLLGRRFWLLTWLLDWGRLLLILHILPLQSFRQSLSLNISILCCFEELQERIQCFC